MNNTDITVILPIHNVSGKFKEWFPKAITSLEQSHVKPGHLLLVCADNKEVKDFMESWVAPEGISTKILYNNENLKC